MMVSVDPLTLLRIGSSALTIKGSGMMEFHNLRCNFVGSGWTWITVKSPTLGFCAVPFVLGSESFSHQILQVESILSQKAILAVFEYVVMEPIEIKRVTPMSGLVVGGTNMAVLTDTNVLMNVVEYSALYCSFGAIVVPATVLNNSALSCYTPPVYKALTVPVDIRIAATTAHSTQSAVLFTFVNAIRMEKIVPARISSAGGVVVSVSTTDFVPDGLRCSFGSILVPAEIVDQTVVCVSPPHPEAFVPLRLLDGDGVLMSENALVVEFYLLAGKVSISPSNGIVYPGTTIGIELEGLASALNVECSFRGENESLPSRFNASIISTGLAECTIPTGKVSPPSKLFLSVSIDSIDVVYEMELYLCLSWW